MANLEFIEDGHRYLYDGKEIPSVSEITRFIQREVYRDADPLAMEVAADRGTRVHKACEEYDKESSVICDGDISGYVEAYTKFLKEHDVDWELIEEPVVDTLDEYAGTLDRFGYIDGRTTLLDIKTTKRISKKHKLQYATQLTAYAYTDMLDDEWAFWNDIDLVILQLKDDGTYKLIKVEPEADIFESCLKLHRAFEATKRRKKNG